MINNNVVRAEKSVIYAFMLLVVSVVLAACAGPTAAPQVDRRAPQVPTIKEAPASRAKPAAANKSLAIRSQARRPVVPAAAKAIQRKAMQQLSEGSVDAAIMTAERGLRIAKNYPDLLWILARSYELKSDLTQAGAFAQQGLRYSLGQNSRRFEKILVRTSH